MLIFGKIAAMLELFSKHCVDMSSAGLWLSLCCQYTLSFEEATLMVASDSLFCSSALTVTTHALHLMSLWSNHHHHSKWLIILLKCFTSSPSQRPSFEHAGLTCYTLLSPSITFSLFHSELKTYLFRQKILSSTLVCLSVRLISWLWTIFWIFCLSVLRFTSIF